MGTTKSRIISKEQVSIPSKARKKPGLKSGFSEVVSVKDMDKGIADFMRKKHVRD